MLKHTIARSTARLLSPAGRRGRLAVFCYHQVLDTADGFRSGEPTVAEFAKDVELIDTVFTVLPFGEAVVKLMAGSLPARAACITFDDGYENNHSFAAPVLESAGVPATFFIAGGAVDDGVMWNDLVIESIARSQCSLKIDEAFSFLKNPEPGLGKAETVAAVLAQLKYKPMHERWQISQRLFGDNVGPDLPRLMMTRELVRDLSKRGFEIGGHTISHPILKEQSDENARDEIQGCRDWVQTVTGVAPVSFAYPNGRSGIDFDARHKQMVADAGFLAASSTDWALATHSTDAFSVPRIGPWWRQGRGLESGLLRTYLRSYL
jgi:peptidoglycan/xylan/chitin deacetylase (PgdA/CDA1 family)